MPGVGDALLGHVPEATGPGQTWMLWQRLDALGQLGTGHELDDGEKHDGAQDQSDAVGHEGGQDGELRVVGHVGAEAAGDVLHGRVDALADGSRHGEGDRDGKAGE